MFFLSHGKHLGTGLQRITNRKPNSWCANFQSRFLSFLMWNSYDVIEVMKKAVVWMIPGLPVLSRSYNSKYPCWASKVPVACSHNLLLILFYKVLWCYWKKIVWVVWFMLKGSLICTKARLITCCKDSTTDASGIFVHACIHFSPSLRGEILVKTTVVLPWDMYLKRN